jgi:hypothetical protein
MCKETRRGKAMKKELKLAWLVFAGLRNVLVPLTVAC